MKITFNQFARELKSALGLSKILHTVRLYAKALAITQERIGNAFLLTDR